MAPRKLVENLPLDAIQHDLFTGEHQAVFEQEKAKLLAEHRRVQKPDHQKATKRLQEVEDKIANTLKAITAGILTPSTKMVLERAEAEHLTILRTVHSQQKNMEKIATFLPNAIGRFKTLIDDLANVTQL